MFVQQAKVHSDKGIEHVKNVGGGSTAATVTGDAGKPTFAFHVIVYSDKACTFTLKDDTTTLIEMPLDANQKIHFELHGDFWSSAGNDLVATVSDSTSLATVTVSWGRYNIRG